MTATRQPDGKWSVDFYLSGRGSQRIRRSGFPSKAHAVRFERDYLVKPDQTSARLSSLAELWYQVHGINLKNGKPRYIALQQTVSRLRDPLCTDFTPADWSRYRVERLKTSARSTVNIEHVYVSSMFAELTRQGHYQGPNPLASIRLFKVDQKSLAFLTFDQIALLLSELGKCANPYVTAIVRLALSTGARWSEVQNLRRSQVLPDRIVFTLTKNGRNRTVPTPIMATSRHGPSCFLLFKCSGMSSASACMSYSLPLREPSLGYRFRYLLPAFCSANFLSASL